MPQVDWAGCVRFAPGADFAGLSIFYGLSMFAQPVVLNVSSLQWSIVLGVLLYPRKSIVSDISILPQINGAKCVHFAPGTDFYNGGKSTCN